MAAGRRFVRRRPDPGARPDGDEGGDQGRDRKGRRSARRSGDRGGGDGFDPRHDADPHLSRARASRRRSRSARAGQAGSARRPLARIPRLLRGRARPQDLRRRLPRPATGRRSASSSRSCAPTTAARSASNTCTSPTWRNAASCRTGWKAPTSRSTSPCWARRRSSRPSTRGEQYEKFLGRKYVGTKRFGLDGGESMIPALEAVIKRGGQMGVREIVIGMAHRGRLNVLANVMAKPYRVIFHEFSGGSANPEDVGGSGDVKYHLGTSTDREFDGIKVHMSLVPNPSHLETVDPVVLGKVRATLTMRDDLDDKDQVLPVLLHGDAAFAGQGIVWERLGFQGIRGYATGGCVHFIINNQIGFTTSPQFARNSPYPSDVAKGVQAPIFHVNGDDPEAVTFACKLAIDFRQKFDKDVVIDMWCYRRFGHNEGDEPSFTQPLMYAKIRQHPPVSEIYAKRLVEEGVIDAGYLGEYSDRFVGTLETEFEAAKSYKPNEADWFAGRWSGFNKPNDPENARRNVPTGIENKLLDSLGRTLTTVPEGLEIHKTLNRVLDGKRQAFKTGEGFDWATGEALAFGSLLSEGYGVRLSGQDSGRGTFSQRHAVWVDQNDEHKYVPLATVPHGRFEVLDSPLSEYGVLGFEYGYAMTDPKTLVLWEAQFGDFANGAQIIIDQYIAAAEAKWLRANGLVLLLPHGYEGQGPEHSSARLERFLQLCAQDNIQVCNITTPSNYFHVLRRQMHRSFRKPLIIMTPKSLLRHPLAKSELEDFIGNSHFRRIMSDRTPPADEAVKKLVLCSGKVGYDLMEARDAAELKDVTVVRLEQLYPFPGEPLALRVAKMPNLEEVVWCQEEPKNQGAWFFVEHLIEESLKEAKSKVKTSPLRRPLGQRLARHRPRQAARGRAGRTRRRCAGPVGPLRNPPPFRQEVIAG
ncbi:MAG: 2-oxoglutarate dehydrogenase E1 component [Chryseolinea sp.]